MSQITEGQPEARRDGRRAEAARNDERILEAARTVFVADPTAPIAAVASQAGVGISALYRRYPSKEDLLRKLCRDGLATYTALVAAAVADPGAPWPVFVRFMRDVMEADTHSLTINLAGTFTPTEELGQMAAEAEELNQRLLDRVQTAGVVRPDLTTTDLDLILEQLIAVRIGDEQRTAELRHRYLALVLEALHLSPSEPSAPLPGPAPTPAEITARWYR